MKVLIILLVVILSYNNVYASDAGWLTFKNGMKMEYDSISVENDIVWVTKDGAKMKVLKSELTDECIQQLPISSSINLTTNSLTDDTNTSPGRLVVPSVSPNTNSVVSKPGSDQTTTTNTLGPGSPQIEKILVPPSPTQAQNITSTTNNDNTGEVMAGPLVGMTSVNSLPDSLTEPVVTAGANNYNVKEGTFELPSNLFGNPTIRFFYRVPIDLDNNIPDSANNIVFYSPYTGEVVTKNTLSHQYPQVHDLTNTYGMTVFSWNLVNEKGYYDDKAKFPYYRESGSFDTFKAGYEKLLTDLNLKKTGLYFLCQSGGSTFAERFAVSNPDLVKVVTMCGGGRFEDIDKAYPISWCILHTRGDTREPENVELVKQIRNHNMNVVYGITKESVNSRSDWENPDENLHHIASNYALTILEQYIVDIMRLQQNGLTSLDYSKWPYYSISTDPYTVHENSSALSDTRSNIFFPSSDFVNLWDGIPYRYYQITDASLLSPLQVILCYPQQPAQGVVVLPQGLTSDEVDEMEYLSSYGYIVVGGKFSLRQRICSRENQVLVKWILSQDSFKDYPIFIAGLGSGGRHAIISASQIENPRILGVAACEAPLEWPFPDLSPIEYVPDLNCNVYLIYMQSNEEIDRFTQKAHDLNKNCTVSLNKAFDTDFRQIDQINYYFHLLASGK